MHSNTKTNKVQSERVWVQNTFFEIFIDFTQSKSHVGSLNKLQLVDICMMLLRVDTLTFCTQQCAGGRTTTNTAKYVCFRSWIEHMIPYMMVL